MKTIGVFIFGSLLMSCASTQESHAPTSRPDVQAAQRPRPGRTHAEIQAEVDSVNGQIAHMDMLIAGAQARIQSFLGLPNNDAMIAGAQGELSAYLSQRASLEAKRVQLQSEFSLQR